MINTEINQQNLHTQNISNLVEHKIDAEHSIASVVSIDKINERLRSGEIKIEDAVGLYCDQREEGAKKEIECSSYIPINENEKTEIKLFHTRYILKSKSSENQLQQIQRSCYAQTYC